MNVALASVALVGGAITAPTTDATTNETPDAIVVSVSESGFRAANASATDALLIVGSEVLRAPHVTVLPAGAKLGWDVPFGATEGATLEVVQLDVANAAHSLTSGVHSIDLGGMAGAPLLMTTTATHTSSYAMVPSSTTPLFLGATSTTTVSTALSSAAAAAGGAAIGALFHVPAVTPLEPTGTPMPPRLDEVPLPPI